MESREINKLKKQRVEILNQDYSSLSDSKREKSWSRIANLDFKLRKLGYTKRM